MSERTVKMETIHILYIINLVLSIFGVLLGFIVVRLYKTLDDLKRNDEIHTKELNKLKVDIPTNYASREDLLRIYDSITNQLEGIRGHMDTKLDKIFDSLEKKADK